MVQYPLKIAKAKIKSVKKIYIYIYLLHTKVYSSLNCGAVSLMNRVGMGMGSYIGCVYKVTIIAR